MVTRVLGVGVGAGVEYVVVSEAGSQSVKVSEAMMADCEQAAG
jgi:hypothetical protein